MKITSKRLLLAIKLIFRKLGEDDVTGYAAQSCFYIILSFFPFIMLLLSLIRYLPISYDTILDFIMQITPLQIHTSMATILSELYVSSSIALTFVSAIATCWSAAKGVLSLMRGFNSVYDLKENRNFIYRQVLAALYTFAFLIIIICNLLILVFGNQLFNFLSIYYPDFAPILDGILDQKYLIFPAMLLIFFICIYKFIPNRKTSILHEFPGALFASAGWFLFSYGYSVYVDHSPKFSYMYGSLATLIFALIWLYTCMTILFYGGEINVFIRHKVLKRLFRKEKQ